MEDKQYIATSQSLNLESVLVNVFYCVASNVATYLVTELHLYNGQMASYVYAVKPMLVGK